jgi:hypothetical protein
LSFARLIASEAEAEVMAILIRTYFMQTHSSAFAAMRTSWTNAAGMFSSTGPVMSFLA